MPNDKFNIFQGNVGGMMGGQQAMAGAFRSSNMGGYDSDVEGGNANAANGMENSFSDKAVSDQC